MDMGRRHAGDRGWHITAVAFVAVALGGVGCGDDDGPRYEPPPEGCAVALWDPADGEITRWPEPDLLVEDPATGTGYRIEVDPERYAPTLETAGLFENIFTEELSNLDGFGINSQIFFRFDEPFDTAMLPSGEATAAPDTGLGIVVLEPGGPRIEPHLLRTTDEDTTLMMVPMHPLPEQTTVVAFATTALAPAAGGCVWPSEATFARIHGDDPAVSEAISALVSLGIIGGPDELVALDVFPTQTITDDSAAIAEHIEGRTVELDGPITCTEDVANDWTACDGHFLAADYRGPDGVIRRNPGDPVEPSQIYSVPFTAWLPLTQGALPYETIVFGHGLGSGREQGTALARFAARLGIATVAIPAVQHGQHPTVPPDAAEDLIANVLRFFAVGQGDDTLEGLVLRDHWRQSTYDKLQLTQLLEGGLDVDGDSAVDLDPDRLAYLGVSLGGIMGSELAALTDTYSAVLLVVPGGRVTSIIGEGPQFEVVIPLLAGGRPEGDIRRFFPILQTLIDRGDAASYGPHVLRDRLTGADVPPDVLMGVVLDDDTVPNVSNYTLVRAIGAPQVPPVLRPYPGMEVSAEMAPLSGNLAGGMATAGVLQFDTVGDGMGGIETATHSNVGDSDVGAEAWLQFLMTHWDTGLAVIVDPYETLGVPHATTP